MGSGNGVKFIKQSVSLPLCLNPGLSRKSGPLLRDYHFSGGPTIHKLRIFLTFSFECIKKGSFLRLSKTLDDKSNVSSSGVSQKRSEGMNLSRLLLKSKWTNLSNPENA